MSWLLLQSFLLTDEEARLVSIYHAVAHLPFTLMTESAAKVTSSRYFAFLVIRRDCLLLQTN